jgi:hypothetical protein
MNAGHGHSLELVHEQAYRNGIRKEGADNHPITMGMGTKEAEWVAMVSTDYGLNLSYLL